MAKFHHIIMFDYQEHAYQVYLTTVEILYLLAVANFATSLLLFLYVELIHKFFFTTNKIKNHI